MTFLPRFNQHQPGLITGYLELTDDQRAALERADPDQIIAAAQADDELTLKQLIHGEPKCS